MTNLLDLPHHLAILIVTLVAKSGFQNLAPLIASGSEGCALAFNELVWREASLRLIEEQPGVIKTNSIFRPFFVRTIKARNPTSMYLEGVRDVAKYGDYRDAIPMFAYKWSNLFRKEKLSMAMSFMLTLLVLCVGKTDEGIALMTEFRTCLEEEDEGDIVAQRVFYDFIRLSSQSTVKGRSMIAKFKRKIPTIEFDLYEECTKVKKCPTCYTFWRCQRFKQLFDTP